MMKKFFLLLLGCCLFAAQNAHAEDATWYHSPTHFLILMPSYLVEFQGDSEEFEGAEFPLFCGIASVYPEENRFVFTKMTHLPIRRVEKWFRQTEKDGYLSVPGHPPRQASFRDRYFLSDFMFWINCKQLKAYHVSSGQEIPLKAVPRFKRTCRYASAKEPPTDCAYEDWDIKDLYIPFTEEEMEQIAKDHAK